MQGGKEKDAKNAEPRIEKMNTTLPKPFDRLKVVEVEAGVEARIITDEENPAIVARLFFDNDQNYPEGRMDQEEIRRLKEIGAITVIMPNGESDELNFSKSCCGWEIEILNTESIDLEETGPTVFFLPAEQWVNFFPE